MMERRRFNRTLSNDTSKQTLQKQLAMSRRATTRAAEPPPPDLTDFMNDMFFGTIKSDPKEAYNLTGIDDANEDEKEKDGFDDSVRSNSSSRSTQEWLDEAKRMVASSPSRCESPSRLAGAPRFASAGAAAVRTRGEAVVSLSDRRDPLNRSARRHRGAESISNEILLKSAKHNRNKSEPFDHPSPTSNVSPVSAVHRWFSDILKPYNFNPPNPIPEPNPTVPIFPEPNPTVPPLPPTSPRRSRFQIQSQGIPTRFSRRTFRNTTHHDNAVSSVATDTGCLSPPKNLIDTPHRRSVSSSTCSFQGNDQMLSPPKNLIESAHRRSISSTTCSTNKIKGRSATVNVPQREEEVVNLSGDGGLNGFLKEQRGKIRKILSGEMNRKAKIVLSGPSNSTSSMVAAICYAWLLENKTKTKKNGVEGNEGTQPFVVVPVMNMRRGKMLKQRQVAWLFHHVGLDATSLLFSDEVDLETLMMSKKLSIFVVGQDILKTNGEVGSQCTILTDNYCEDAYDLLQTPILKKLMIAGILLDTDNLNMSGKLPLARDSEAVQLLSVGSAPNYRNTLYDQLVQDQRDSSFVEALRKNYAKSPDDGSGESRDSGKSLEKKNQEKKSNPEEVTTKSSNNSNDEKNVKISNKASPRLAPSPAPTKKEDASRGKNTFFLAKWFGFGK